MGAHQARKRFGQHFLVDRELIARLVGLMDVRRDDAVVEIGPGLGALTTPLLSRLNRLDVVEIDRDLVAHLCRHYAGQPLIVHQNDALTFDFACLATAVGGRLRVVGNLPYNISTPILFRLAGFAAVIDDMHLMLQREVVERMVAMPGSGDYGRLTVMLQYDFTIEKLLDVPPAAFSPPPRVHSAVVRLFPRRERDAQAIDRARFAAVVAKAFMQRRKMLRNSLATLPGDLDLAALGISATTRAEDLAVADYVRLANQLSRRAPSH